jgi:hypothetical protein
VLCPWLTVGVYEARRDAVVRAGVGVRGGRLAANGLADDLEPLLPLGEVVWLLAGVQEQSPGRADSGHLRHE